MADSRVNKTITEFHKVHCCSYYFLRKAGSWDKAIHTTCTLIEQPDRLRAWLAGHDGEV
ncbi:MAG TPA: hypothetical protein VF599_20175 [Pyrinomonadaceae bacterium]